MSYSFLRRRNSSRCVGVGFCAAIVSSELFRRFEKLRERLDSAQGSRNDRLGQRDEIYVGASG